MRILQSVLNLHAAGKILDYALWTLNLFWQSRVNYLYIVIFDIKEILPNFKTNISI